MNSKSLLTIKRSLLALILTFLCASAARTFAQNSTTPPAQTPTSVNTVATPTPVPKTVPRAILADPDALRFVQTLLANQSLETARADDAERQALAWKAQAGEWRGLYDDETKRSALLKGATADRKEAGQDLKTANFFLQEQHADDKSRISEQDKEISSLRKSRLKWAAGGFLFGGGTCLVSTVPNIFH